MSGAENPLIRDMALWLASAAARGIGGAEQIEGAFREFPTANAGEVLEAVKLARRMVGADHP